MNATLDSPSHVRARRIALAAACGALLATSPAVSADGLPPEAGGHDDATYGDVVRGETTTMAIQELAGIAGHDDAFATAAGSSFASDASSAGALATAHDETTWPAATVPVETEVEQAVAVVAP
ncbi:MAG TPA: hypothetical protein VD838_01890 [Anaeromyxobacteraceae bacterium]|nr:hypothetical protein [Anaeromyxobacteraceae bacterium]